MIEDKITQASWDGKVAALQVFGLHKVAGYFQNIVGFDSPEQLTKLRELGDDYVADEQAMMAAYKQQREYWKARDAAQAASIGLSEPKKPPTGFWQRLFGKKTETTETPWRERLKEWQQKYEADNPEPEVLDAHGRAKAIGAEPLGWMGKYTVIPKLYPYGSEEPYSGASTGQGYLSKEELLKQLEDMSWAEHHTPDLLERVRKSPRKFFTTTDIE